MSPKALMIHSWSITHLKSRKMSLRWIIQMWQNDHHHHHKHRGALPCKMLSSSAGGGKWEKRQRLLSIMQSSEQPVCLTVSAIEKKTKQKENVQRQDARGEAVMTSSGNHKGCTQYLIITEKALKPPLLNTTAFMENISVPGLNAVVHSSAKGGNKQKKTIRETFSRKLSCGAP